MAIPDIEYVETCLSYIDPNLPRNDWVNIGMAIQYELGDDVGYEVFKRWSMGGESFKSRQFESTWKSFKQGYQTFKMGTLVFYAKSGGFDPRSIRPPRQKSADELAKIEAARRKSHEQQLKDAAQQAKSAQETAIKRWNKSPPVDQVKIHPYLIKKGCEHPVGPIKQYRNFLQIPAFNKEGKLTTLLSINQEGSKFFIKDGVLSGSSMTIGKRKANMEKPILLCEGWATAQSVYQGSLLDYPETGLQVVVAFNSNNLIHVARNIREHYPNRSILICADNDCRNHYNAGVMAAQQTKDALTKNVGIIFPVFSEEIIQAHLDQNDSAPSDFNDLHAISGLEAVAGYIREGVAELGKQQALENDHSSDLEI